MSDLKGQTVGFIGLGIMGNWMSRNLMAAGARLVVCDLVPEAVQSLVEAGAEAAASPADVASRADTVILMVTDTPSVETVLLGDDGVVGALRPGSLVIDMGTTLATATRRFAGAIAAAGCDFVDGPVSGGEIGARDGTLTIMAGGTEDAFSRALPFFEVMGNHVTRVGDIGAGHVAKAANQVIVGLTIGAVAEALTLARKAGVDPAKVREALMGGFAQSRILEVHGQRMIDNSFEPGGHVSIQRKDMNQAMQLAAEYGLDLPATHLNRDLYDKLIAAGHAKLDHSALIKAIDPDLM